MNTLDSAVEFAKGLPLYVQVPAAFVCLLLWVYILSLVLARKPLNLAGAHVVITGGSSGIGKAMARLALQRGATVTLLARNKKRLKEAQEELSALLGDDDENEVNVESVDMSDADAVTRTFDAINDKYGHIDVLVNSAGMTHPQYFEKISADTWDNMFALNVEGSAHAVRAVLPHMRSRGEGHIMFVSSAAGLAGIFGYTAYSASKFALRGFAEALAMEVRPQGITVTLGFPPDTDTPMFAEENKMKPRETALVSEGSGVWSADDVAKQLLDDMCQHKFFSGVGTDGWMLTTVTAGMAPATSLWEGFTQVLLASPLRLVGICYQLMWAKIVADEWKRRKTED